MLDVFNAWYMLFIIMPIHHHQHANVMSSERFLADVHLECRCACVWLPATNLCARLALPVLRTPAGSLTYDFNYGARSLEADLHS